MTMLMALIMIVMAEIDEDVDTSEPNDASMPFYMGELDQIGDSVTANVMLTAETDVDAVSFYLVDNFSWTPLITMILSVASQRLRVLMLLPSCFLTVAHWA